MSLESDSSAPELPLEAVVFEHAASSTATAPAATSRAVERRRVRRRPPEDVVVMLLSPLLEVAELDRSSRVCPMCWSDSTEP